MLIRLLRYLRPHRRFALLTAGFGFAGFLLSFVYPWIIGSVVDLVTVGGRSPTRLLWFTEIAVLTAVLHAVVLYGRGHFNSRLADAVMVDMRAELFRHLHRLGQRFHSRARLGGLLSRLLTDVHESIGIVYAGVIVMGMDCIQLCLALGFLAHMSWKLTLATATLFPLYALVFLARNPHVRVASQRQREAFAMLSSNASEQLSAQALIKAFATEEREVGSFKENLDLHHRLVTAQSHEGHLLASASELLVHLGTTTVVGFGGWLVLQNELSAGMIMRFLGYILIMYGPVRRFAEINTVYQSSLSSMRRVFEVLDTEPDVKNPVVAWATRPSRGAIRFDNASFRYDGEREPVLDGVSLSAREGERIAIVGHSGAGKTTLVSLVPRYYDVTGGRVLVDGIDVRHYNLAALRSSIAIVQQDTFVFSGTLRHNIAYGRPDASDAEIQRAAEAAHAHEFIQRFPDGYDTLVGERGVTLSGGQRQRVSIARAFLSDSRIIIFDEATSALDAESESVVQAALRTLMNGRTCLVVAHRLSTIRDADRIVVLEQGRIVQSGSHSELIGREGTYARLVRKQA
jgi:ABC-type multidrug transport system fused ATPase/permease subunit